MGEMKRLLYYLFARIDSLISAVSSLFSFARPVFLDDFK